MGSLALAGGNEFRDNCKPMDEHLLARVKQASARVVILPTAAIRGSPRLAAENGVRHFTALGARAAGAMVISRADADDPRHAEQVLTADLVYLAGGEPGYLLDTLRDTAVWRAIQTVYERGGLVAGSSAGAMVLAEMSGPPASPDWRPALDLAHGVAVAPHYSASRADQVSRWRQLLPSSITLLGIPEATACLSDEGRTWQVVGNAAVAVYAADTLTTYKPGTTFQLPT